MSLYSTAMRTIRQYMVDASANQKKHDDKLATLEAYKGSTYYIGERDRLAKDTADSLEYIRKQAKGELADIIKSMRENIRARATKAPTQDMAASLSILNQLNNVSVAQMRMYAQTMADCPLAMQMLSQIAKKYNVMLTVPDIEQMSRSVDVLEHNLALALTYDGTTNAMRPSLDMIRPYFQPDDAYLDMSVKTAEKANDAFWNNIVQCGSPAMLESPSSTPLPVEVYHVFADLDGLLKYIDANTAGMNDVDRDSKVNEILSECPDNYGAVYRNYLATGEKLAFSGSNGTTEE